jgi:hypothetical protein
VKTSTRLFVALALVLSATAVAYSTPGSDTNDPAWTGGGSYGYNANLPKNTD